jgi:NAD(P)-dependent dehydrogenase (short-subunit alcohol dehydrogenase family)
VGQLFEGRQDMAKRSSVVVTGASTGIGSACVKVLAAAGFHVFGSVRKPADAERLAKEFGASFTPLIFDVTDQAAVARAAQTVEQALAGTTLAVWSTMPASRLPGPCSICRSRSSSSSSPST